jgi:hypothetical protein
MRLSAFDRIKNRSALFFWTIPTQEWSFMMNEVTRRQFSGQTISSLLTLSLLDLVCRQDAFADEVKPLTVRWLNEVNELGVELKDAKLKQVEWQKKIEELFLKVNLPDLLRTIDFDRLVSGAKLVDNGALSLRFNFGSAQGLPTNLVFGRQIFALKKGRSVVPHGHNNMATAFLILKGDCEGKHYDRLKDEPEHYIIKPTIDRKFEPGECSTISDHKDNVHWFKALTEKAFIFNIHVMNIAPERGEPTGRVYLDPSGEKLAGGLIRARRLDYEEAHKLYG